MEAILEAVLGVVLEVIIEPLLAVIGYLLLTVLVAPLFFLICTPLVLILACFGPGSYDDKVVSGYKGAWAAATSCGGLMPW